MINKMKFRQRVAWLMVIAYLGGTFSFCYYMFEINEHYNKYAVDHVQKYHSTNNGDSQPRSVLSSIWEHLADIPLPVWLLVFLVPYLQIFLMILACTRVEPKHSLAYLWPGLLYMKYQQLFKREKYSIIPSKSVHEVTLNGTTNGHTIIHT